MTARSSSDPYHYSTTRKILINLVLAGQNLTNIIVLSSLMKFYTDIIGLSPKYFGIVYFIFTIWNVINDPLIGYWADKRPFRDKYGKYTVLIRRSIPVMLVAILALFYSSPSWSETVIAIYLLIVLLIYEAARATLDVSFAAFKANAFVSMKERTEVQVIGSYISMIPVAVGSVVPIVLLTGEYSHKQIVMLYSIIIAVGLGFSYFGSLFVKEDPKFYENTENATSIVELLKVFLLFCKNKAFLIFIVSFFFVQAATGNYFVGYIYYMDNVLLVDGLLATLPDILTGFVQMALFPFVIIGVKKYGSKKTLIVGFLLSIVSLLVLSVDYVGMFEGEGITTNLFGTEYFLSYAYITVSIIFLLLLGSFSVNSALLNPMKSLIVDELEMFTGKRQPATVESIIAIFMTAAGAMPTLILSFLMEQTGYISEQKAQSFEVMQAIRFGNGLIPAIILLIGLLVFLKFPIDKKREKEIQQFVEDTHNVNS